MANITILGETLDNGIVDTDFLLYWKAASGVQRRVSRASLIGATLTGGGTIATGGFTLTVPATGTASLLAAAQTFTALKTFSSGISFGQTTLDYYEKGTWTPVIADAPSGGNTGTAGTSYATYFRIGKMVYVTCTLLNITTTGMTAGNLLYIRGLPFSSSNNAGFRAPGNVLVGNVTYTGMIVPLVLNGVSYIRIFENLSGSTNGNITVSDLTSGSALLEIQVNYEVD